MLTGQTHSKVVLLLTAERVVLLLYVQIIFKKTL